MFYVGKVKWIVRDELSGISGVKLLLISESNEDNFIIFNPITKHGFSIFYRDYFNRFIKDKLDIEYKSFLEHALSTDSQVILYISKNEMKYLRSATTDDIQQYNESFKWFANKNNIEFELVEVGLEQLPNEEIIFNNESFKKALNVD